MLLLLAHNPQLVTTVSHCIVGSVVGTSDGALLGSMVGLSLGSALGEYVGEFDVGMLEGVKVGRSVGACVGIRVGARVGVRVGALDATHLREKLPAPRSTNPAGHVLRHRPWCRYCAFLHNSQPLGSRSSHVLQLFCSSTHGWQVRPNVPLPIFMYGAGQAATHAPLSRYCAFLHEVHVVPAGEHVWQFETDGLQNASALAVTAIRSSTLIRQKSFENI